MAFQKTSIATLVVIVLVAEITLLSGVMGSINHAGVRARMRQDLQAKLDRQCESLATSLALATWNIDRGQIDRIIDSAMKDPEVFGVVVTAADQTHVKSRDPAWEARAVERIEVPPRHLLKELPITFGDETIGRTVVVVSPATMESNLRSSLLNTALAIALVDLVLILSLYWLLRRIVLRPLKVLEGYAVSVSSGESLGHPFAGLAFQGELEVLRSSLAKTVLLLDGRYEALEKANDRLQVELVERERAEAERHKLEERLVAAQRMESIGRLAGGVAHDFNNMLAVIYGNLDFLREQLPEDSPMIEDVDGIQEAANRARDITHQLLAFSRKQAIEVKPLDLNRVVEGVEKMLSRLLGEGIKIRVRPCGADAWVNADASQLEQVLMNLCINARDAMPHGGQLEILTEVHFINEGEAESMPGLIPGDYVLLAVSDNGTGMDPVTLRQVFDPFFTTKPVGKGTGLGLATVHGIIKQHGGEVTVYSEVGRGTTFRIYLPRVGSTGLEREAETARPCRGQGQTVLVMEDEEVLRRIVGQMLQRLGYNPIVASGLGEAMELAAKAGKVNLFLTDVIMPDTNGRQAYETMLAVYPDLKVLYMSGYTSDLISVQGILEDGVYFIAKPFTERDLGAKIQEVLASTT